MCIPKSSQDHPQRVKYGWEEWDKKLSDFWQITHLVSSSFRPLEAL